MGRSLSIFLDLGSKGKLLLGSPGNYFPGFGEINALFSGIKGAQTPWGAPYYILRLRLSNSYTMGCPPVRGDNPRALASGLSYVQVDKHGITILYHLHQC